VRTLFALISVAALAAPIWANVWPVVCCYDEKTPLEVVDSNNPSVFRDIMAGTRLTIVLRSDQSEYFCGGLVMSWDDIVIGDMMARGTPDKFWNYPDSCLYDSGSDAQTWPMDDSHSHGFQFVNTYFRGDRRFRDAVPGDWFIMDYHAVRPGSCTIDFFNYEIDWLTPLATLTFHHVPTRDFNGDRIVNLKDFAAIAARRRSAPQIAPDTIDVALDLDANQHIGISDLKLFGDFWLERTDIPEPAGDPNLG